ncbi:MAG: hypothetical protein ACI30Y_03765 [Candidatus Limisoma sp.]
MLTPELEQLINYALEDGVLTDKERSVLMRKAQAAGADLDEFEMILEAKLHEVQKTAAAVAPKSNSNKHGEIRKCPACGAMVSAFSTRCSECGFEFNNVEANKSANTLFEKLQALEMEKARELAQHEESKNKQLLALSERHNSGGTLTKIFANNGKAQNEERDDLIRTLEKGARLIERKYMDAKINMIKVFAVPNTKGDLLELLSMASSSAYDNDGVIGPEEEAWLQKTDQIYQKLVICAAGDNITLNQATNMIISLIKRLPQEYKNFTRIPKELRDKINVELKAQKAERNKEFKEDLLNILKGWHGITLGVALLLFIIDCFVQTVFILIIAIIVLIVVGKMTWRAIKEAKKDLLY